jgi:hypothetical protein
MVAIRTAGKWVDGSAAVFADECLLTWDENHGKQHSKNTEDQQALLFP